MAALLGEARAIAPAPVPTRRTRKRKDVYALSDDDAPGAGTYREPDAGFSSDGGGFDGGLSGDDRAWAASPRKKARTGAATAPALPPIGRLAVQSDHEDAAYEQAFDDDFDIDMDDAAPPVKQEAREDVKLPPLPLPAPAPKPSLLNSVKKEEAPAWLATYDALAVAKTEEHLGGGARAASAVDALEPDGSLRFFWLDYLEHDGRVYFVGKVRDRRADGAWASCCIAVEGVQRNLFVLPRERRVESVLDPGSDEEDEDEDDMADEDDDDDERAEKKKKKGPPRKRAVRQVDTDDIPEEMDVYNDFDQVRRKAGIKKFRARFVNRKYAFGEKDVPREERRWLKVVYGFDGARAGRRGSVGRG
jgi:DNA polymerase alpha subunit A